MSKARERTKVVVRNLPPALTEDALRAVVDKAAGGKYGWSAFYPGKVRCGAARGFLNTACGCRPPVRRESRRERRAAALLSGAGGARSTGAAGMRAQAVRGGCSAKLRAPSAAAAVGMPRTGDAPAGGRATPARPRPPASRPQPVPHGARARLL